MYKNKADTKADRIRKQKMIISHTSFENTMIIIIMDY